MIKRICLGCILTVALSLGMLNTGCEDDDSSPAATATGTSSVRGNVNSISDPLPGAVARNSIAGLTVKLVGGVTLETTTDANGIFQFPNVPAGEYTVVIIINGEEHEITITVGEAEEVVIREIKIDAAGHITVGAIYTEDEEDEAGPIPIAGDWSFSLINADRVALPAVAPSRLVVIQEGNSLSGTLDNMYTFTGTIDGNTVNFTFTLLPGRMPILLSATGTVNAEATSMSGTALLDTGEQTWSATAGYAGL